MATQAPSKPSDTQDDASKEAIAQAAREQASKLKRTVDAELNKLDELWSAFSAHCRTIGTLGQEELAKRCGLSVTAIGRPARSPYAKFSNVVVEHRDAKGERMGFKPRNRLFDIALKAVGSMKGEEGHYTPKSDEELKKAKDRFVKSKGKGSDDKASVSLTMARPATEEIALGE